MIFNNVFNKASMTTFAWILAIVATALLTSVESLRGWLMVSVLAIGPGAVLLHFAKTMPRTTLQRIHEARR